MNVFKTFPLFIFLLFFATACHDNDDERPTGPQPREKVERTVLVYIVGDAGDSNELSDLLKRNFYDMKEGMKDVDYSKCNLVVYSEMDDDVPHLISLKKVGDRVVADTLFTYDEQNPLKKEVMTSVMRQTVNYCPADSYGMIFLSHSASWVPARKDANSRYIGYYRKSQMNIQDFREAIVNAFPVPLKFILFDSCLMQSIEVAYELRDCAEYLIGSPTEIPGPGAPYKTLVPELYSKTDAAVKIADSYYRYYENNYNGMTPTNSVWTAGVSVSVVNTANLEQLTNATRLILTEHVGMGEAVDRSKVMLYDLSSNKANYDLDNLVQRLTGGKDNVEYQLWRIDFNDVVEYWKTTPKNFSIYQGLFSMQGSEGLSIYIPYGESNSALNSFYRTLQWYPVGGWQQLGW